MFKVNNSEQSEHISHLFPSVSIVHFEQINVSWVNSCVEYAHKIEPPKCCLY